MSGLTPLAPVRDAVRIALAAGAHRAAAARAHAARGLVHRGRPAARPERGPHHPLALLHQADGFVGLQPTDRPPRADAGAKAGLDADDVPDAGDETLVEE